MFTVCWTSVDGAGRFEKQWPTFKEAAAEADRLQKMSDDRGNAFCYRYLVRNEYDTVQYRTMNHEGK